MEFFLDVLFCLIILAIIGVITGFIIIYVTTKDTFPNVQRFPGEKYFVDPNNDNTKCPFPYKVQEPSIDLSLIVPSYNEQERLPVMLEEAIEDLLQRKKENPSFSYEIIIVDDGSKDKTTQVALQFVKKYGTENFRVLTLTRNRGKGGAIRSGMLSSRGKHLLMVDADGATKFSDLWKVQASLNKLVKEKGDVAIAVGSRAHLQDEAVAKRTPLRNLLMYGFHFLVSFLCVKGIRDTQCGFKLFTRPAALLTFSALHVERWAFDVELLYIAQQLNIPISEVAVNWQEIEGSKLVPFWSWLQMGRDLLLIRLRYILGAWKIAASFTNNSAF